MAIPHSVVAAGWIPFVVVLLVSKWTSVFQYVEIFSTHHKFTVPNLSDNNSLKVPNLLSWSQKINSHNAKSSWFQLTLLFSFIYVRYFQSKYDSEVCSTIASILGVAVALLTTALVPVDIFLVSIMKDSNGEFKVSLVELMLYAT